MPEIHFKNENMDSRIRENEEIEAPCHLSKIHIDHFYKLKKILYPLSKINYNNVSPFLIPDLVGDPCFHRTYNIAKKTT